MAEGLNTFNFIIFLLYTILYFYQAVYVIVPFVRRDKERIATKNHHYAVVIAARNESAVIGSLIRSVQQQNYPKECLDVLVVADNCTDDTAEIARKMGARVYERFNKEQVGKGYALNFLFQKLKEENLDQVFEGYFIFDADNILDRDYVKEMNVLFDNGYKVLTSYRNSKNYDSNWISAGYSLWFLREAKFLNYSRMLLNTSCVISGTGFLIHRDIVERNGGWKHHLLTEDIEFSVDSILHGERIGYCRKAKFYDEQPLNFKQSWNQRLRWAKGFYQVFSGYGAKLIKTAVRQRSFACFDMLMTIVPAMLLTLISILVNLVLALFSFLDPVLAPEILGIAIPSIFYSFGNFYLVLFIVGVLTTITEWKEIHARPYKKVLYTFTFPLFIFTYVPIAIVALFKKVEWTPISHTIAKDVEDVSDN